MKGLVRKRGNTWTWQFQVERGGRRRTHSRGGYRTKKLAEEALTEALASVRTTSQIESTRVTVGRYLTDWCDQVEHRLKPSTVRGYRDIVTNRVTPMVGEVRLVDLSSADLARLYTALRTSGGRAGQGLSETSIQHTHVTIRKALEDAVRGSYGPRLLARNPADDVARPKRARVEMRTWPAETVATFLAGTSDDRLGIGYTLAVTTGARRGELCGLRWDDIDLDAGQLAVRRARVAAGYSVSEGTPKSGRARTIALGASTVAALRRHRARQVAERLAWGAAYVDSGLVLTRENGEPLHPQTLSQAFERRVTKLGLERIRFHDLRHTSATLALAAGVHPKVVSERLGHASIGITLDVYSHVTKGMQEAAAAELDRVVFGAS